MPFSANFVATKRLTRTYAEDILEELPAADRILLQGINSNNDGDDDNDGDENSGNNVANEFDSEAEAGIVVEIFIQCLYKTIPSDFRLDFDAYEAALSSKYLQLCLICSQDKLYHINIGNFTTLSYAERLNLYFPDNMTLYNNIMGATKRQSGWSEMLKYLSKQT
ncbi:hypothetical protein HK100_006536, partial [Physocladia obscura]